MSLDSREAGTLRSADLTAMLIDVTPDSIAEGSQRRCRGLECARVIQIRFALSYPGPRSFVIAKGAILADRTAVLPLGNLREVRRLAVFALSGDNGAHRYNIALSGSNNVVAVTTIRCKMQ